MRSILSVAQAAVLAMLLTGCVSVARVSDFKTTANGVDFDALAQRDYDHKGAVWTEKTGFEYFIQVDKMPEDELVKSITRALESLDYRIKPSTQEARTIIATRGLHANEWSSVAGVYYRPKEGVIQIYIRDKITQDITGGWRDNRAKDIAQAILAEVKTSPRPQAQK